MSTLKLFKKNPWTDKEDDTLVNIVLEHVRNGETVSKAVEVASKKLKRTSSACSYRWHNNLKQENEKLYKQAKKDGLKSKNAERLKKNRESNHKQTMVPINQSPNNETSLTSHSDKNESNYPREESDITFNTIELLKRHFISYENLIEELENSKKELETLKAAAKDQDNIDELKGKLLLAEQEITYLRDENKNLKALIDDTNILIAEKILGRNHSSSLNKSESNLA